MKNVEKEAKKQGISVDELIQETEQKILDNEYLIQDSINYHEKKLDFRAKIITQREFSQISKKIKDDGARANGELLHNFLIKNQGGKFSHDEIGNLPAGLVAALALRIMELSDFNLDEVKKQQKVGF